MARNRIKYLVILIAGLTACKHKPADNDSNYPHDVAAIMVNKCATSGCHNSQSKAGAGGLDLSTWDACFRGGSSGAVVIPYRPDFSTVCYYTNTYADLGVTLTPAMPLDRPPLTRAEYLTIRDWIASGAPSALGEVKFADNPNRKKMYVTNRLCDVVTVIDATTLLQMRYIDVGDKATSKFPTTIKVSPDKQHWYVSFYTRSDIVQKFSAVDDKLVGSLNLGPGSWTSFAIAADSRHGYFVDNNSPGKVVYADLEHLTVLATYTFNGNFRYPTGIALSQQANKLYIGAASGNFIYSIDITNPLLPAIEELTIDTSKKVQYQTLLDPIDMVVNNTTCYIACQHSKEIRTVNMRTNKLLTTIPLSTPPAVLGFSQYCNKLFVSCPDDSASFAGNRGAIAVIDPNLNTVQQRIKSGYQPYGFAIDDERQIVIVANANLSAKGNAPHHVSGCGGRNGNVSFIDLTTLQLIPGKRSEVAVFPFGLAAR